MPQRSSSTRLRTARPRRIASAAAVAALVAAAAVGVAASATADDGTTLLDGVTGVGDAAAGAGKVFVAAVDRVVVADAGGAVIDTVTGLAGAAGLALSADGTRLYVALRNSNEVAEIDTGTSQVLRKIDLEGHACPTHLALSGSRLWVGYGCDGQWAGGVVTLDVTVASPTVFGVADRKFGAPTVAAAGGVLALGETDLSPSSIYVYSVNGEEATLRGTISVPALNELALSPDGGLLVVASGYPYTHLGYDTGTLAEVRRYGDPNWGYPNAAQISPDGLYLAAGRYSFGGPELVIHTAADGAVVNQADNPAGDLVNDSVAFLGTDVFAVVEDWPNRQFFLWRVARATVPKSAISLTAPTSATALDPMTVTGRLSLADGAAPGAQQLAVTRILPDDTRTTLSATTAVDGTFTITDTPPVSGDVRYDVSWDGTANYQGSSASVTVPVAARAATLTLTGPATGEDGKRLRLSGKLSLDGEAPAEPQILAVTRTIWNNRLNGVTEYLPAVTTDSLGAFKIVDTPTQGGRYVYTVSWDVGSQVYAPASATREIMVSSQDSHVTGQVEDPAYVGEPFRVTGAISYDVGACQGTTTVHVTREVAGGTPVRLPDVATNASCGFGFDDSLARPAEVTYTVTWDGNSTHRGSSGTITGTVQKQPSFIEATSPDRTLLNGQPAIIDGKVAGSRTGSIGARLTLTVNRIGPDGSSVQLRDVSTAADGTFSLRDKLPTMDASTYPQFQYDISWAGNATYEGSSTSIFFYIVPTE
jgi:YVTN family beta-propeller protein